MCCSGLRHVLTRLEGHSGVFLGSLLPRHVPTKKNGSKAVLEVDPEDHAEGGSEDDCKGYIGEDLAVGAFHGVSLSYMLDGAGAPNKKTQPGLGAG